jgi:integrase/recombinase XerD
MKRAFASPLGGHMAAFLAFKRARGFGYVRAEFILRSFDRFLSSQARQRPTWHASDMMLAWLASRPGRKAISVAMYLSVIREFWRYLHRCAPRRFPNEPRWPRLPTETGFAAHVFSLAQVRLLLRLIGVLNGPTFRRALYRTLLLILYCTGLRFGEAVRLRIRDVDLQRRVLFISESKGRSRWVPFHPSLAVELTRYLGARQAFVGYAAALDDPFFVGWNRRELRIKTASETFRRLYRSAKLKPAQGRVGPRPYDLRHTFAVHRLTRWYRQGVDLHGRLPWLSAYLGHVDILGTETYLSATPELMALASDRFRRRYKRRGNTT